MFCFVSFPKRSIVCSIPENILQIVLVRTTVIVKSPMSFLIVAILVKTRLITGLVFMIIITEASIMITLLVIASTVSMIRIVGLVRNFSMTRRMSILVESFSRFILLIVTSRVLFSLVIRRQVFIVQRSVLSIISLFIKINALQFALF
ncbi:hypothetical protein V1478_007298 [Vespula squamosa]|uniref:Uncharacterized protein n=1 Tax=Vespula squamosa TaxID=30214 RepID=A0ABD2B2S7_VESSQ